LPELGEMNLFERPKSIKLMMLAFFPYPIRIFSGFMSRCTKFFEWTY